MTAPRKIAIDSFELTADTATRLSAIVHSKNVERTIQILGHEAVVEFYELVIKSVDGFSVGFVRVAYSYEE